MQRKLPIIVLLGLIIILGLALRLWGNTFGLSHKYAADEWGKVKTALRYEELGFKHTRAQPSFVYNSLYVLFKIMAPAKSVFEEKTNFEDPALPEFKEGAYFLWLGRCWMAFLGSATIFFVYLLGKKLWDGTAGILGAAFFAISPLPVIAAHYIKEDIPLTLGVTITIILCISVAERGRIRDYISAGLASGATFSMKYPGGATFLLLILAHLLHRRREEPSANPGNNKSGKKFPRLFLSMLAFIIGFAIISPIFFCSVSRVFKGVLYQTNYLLTGHKDEISVGALENYFLFYLRNSLLPGITLPVIVAAGIGMWFLWKRRGVGAILVSVWTLGYYFFAELSPAKPYPFYSRYILPIVPALSAFAGIFAARIWSLIREPGKKGRERFLGLAFLALLLIPPLYLTIRYDSAMIPDTRDMAQKWIYANIPRGSTLLLSAYTPFMETEVYPQARLSPQRYREYKRGKERENVFCIISSFAYDRYLENPEDVPEVTSMYKEIMSQDKLLREFRGVFKGYGFSNPIIRVYAIRRIQE